MANSSIKTIIFDIGGVLVDTDYDKVCQPLAQLSGLDVAGVRNVVDGGPVVQAAMKGLIGAGELHEGVCRELGIDLGYEEFCEVWTGLLSLNQGIMPMIESLEPRYNLVLASNTEPIHWSYCARNYDVLNYYHRRFLSFEMGLIKPDPEYFHRVLGGLGASPEECVFIDDRQENVDSAKSVGITAVRFTGNDSLQAELDSICQ